MTGKLLSALRDVILIEADGHSSTAILMEEWAKGAITPSVVAALRKGAVTERLRAAKLREVLELTAPKAEASPS